MKIVDIKVITNAKKNEVIQEAHKLKVKVNAPAFGGRPNGFPAVLIWCETFAR